MVLTEVFRIEFIVLLVYGRWLFAGQTAEVLLDFTVFRGKDIYVLVILRYELSIAV